MKGIRVKVFVLKRDRYGGRDLVPGAVVDLPESRVPDLVARGTVRKHVSEPQRPKHVNVDLGGLPAGAKVLVKL